jgi:carbon-monoxide dehydrogenase small subunit
MAPARNSGGHGDNGKEKSMPEGVTIRVKVNGQWREVAATADRLLIDLLREEFGLTGTKKGCGEGECGACTVILNGRPVLACLIPAAKAEGADILTIEGLTPEQGLHPIQQAFQDEGAVQCGYCTPGMVMTTKALLDENPWPTEAEIKRAISGNLCRCTGYTKVVAAISRSAAALRGETPSPPATDDTHRVDT